MTRYVCACIASDLSSFCEVCNHDNDGATLFPDKAPKVSKRVWQWPLGSDIGLGLVVSLETSYHGYIKHIHIKYISDRHGIPLKS